MKTRSCARAGLERAPAKHNGARGGPGPGGGREGEPMVGTLDVERGPGERGRVDAATACAVGA